MLTDGISVLKRRIRRYKMKGKHKKRKEEDLEQMTAEVIASYEAADSILGLAYKLSFSN
jgi:hypothetical protein